MHTQGPSHAGIAAVLAMTTALGPLALDTYLPAFPAMADSLGVTVHRISLSIPVYVFVLAFGQLVGGPLSDRIGRQRVMLAGLAVFALASALISRVQSVEALLALRALQAFGGGWATVCVAAIVRDRLSGSEAARFFSLIGLMMILAPAIAPSLGSALLAWLGWPGIFLFLCGYTAVVAALLQAMVFRHGHVQAAHRPGVSVWQRYRSVFAVRPALPFMAIQSLAFAVMLLFITHASFIYQQHFGASPGLFAVLFGANVVLMMGVNLLNRHLLKRIAPQRILRWALLMQASGLAALLLVTAISSSVWLFLPAMMVTVGAMGAITPNTQACFMEYFAEHGGTASALLGATQFSLAGLLAAASAWLPEQVSAIVLAQVACSALCLWVAFVLVGDPVQDRVVKQ